MKKLFILCLILIGHTFLHALDVIYEERIPYVQKENKSVVGLVATPAIEALKKTQIPFILKEKPSKRHLHEIKANKQQVCALGWFKNPQRETFAKFSKPLYQDRPMGVIARIEDENIFSTMDIESLLKSQYKLLTKASYSYGEFIDKRIKAHQTKKVEVYVDNEKMLLLIDKKRADYFFISEEEASLFLTKEKFTNLRFFRLSDMPMGNKRYMICSQGVDDEIIARLNQYIK